MDPVERNGRDGVGRNVEGKRRRRRVRRKRVGEGKSRGREGGEGLCSSKNSFKTLVLESGLSLTLRQIDAPGDLVSNFCLLLGRFVVFSKFWSIIETVWR